MCSVRRTSILRAAVDSSPLKLTPGKVSDSEFFIRPSLCAPYLLLRTAILFPSHGATPKISRRLREGFKDPCCELHRGVGGGVTAVVLYRSSRTHTLTQQHEVVSFPRDMPSVSSLSSAASFLAVSRNVSRLPDGKLLVFFPERVEKRMR